MISIIGAGKLGTNLAYILAGKGTDDILLCDIVKSLPQGEALDLMQSYGVHPGIKIRGTNEIRDIKGSELVVVTAGLGRKPGMTRLDLMEKNSEIIKDIAGKIDEYSPDSVIIVVTNPVDIMTYIAQKASGIPKERVIGMGSLLDSLRFSYFASEHLKVPKSEIEALVIGEHGENMSLLFSQSFYKGKPLSELLDMKTREEILDKTIKGGKEVIGMKGATIHAPVSAIAMMAECVLEDQRKTIPACCCLNGEYGYEGIYIGVPAVLGKNGAEKITELDLEKEEKERFSRGAEKIKDITASWKN
ncbi:MAG: malate dehydrogenase [Candidatus Aenigmarchaeota archaeon]